MKKFFTLPFILVATLTAISQNLESIGKEKPITISGGVSVSQMLYGVTGIASRRDPYTYYASGNLNFNLYGWSVPLSFVLSNQDLSYQQPFNQYGFHPTYKWVTAHAGYSSMNFSPYSLNGHIFKGVGVDLGPGDKFQLAAMYGRLLRAIEPDPLNEEAPLPSYNRMGYGLKAHYGDAKYFGELSLFHAKDDSASIAYVPEEEGILPEENLVLTIGAGVTLLEKIQIRTEFAGTAITNDTRAPEFAGRGLFKSFGSIFTPRISTAYYKAVKSNIDYTGNGYSVGIGYERVDPGYRTLGAYYFNNDLESISINGATALAGGKMNLSTNIGMQRDNLDGSKISTLKRVVGSFNIGFTPNEQLNLSTSYSSFRSYANIRSQFLSINQLTPYENLDTLNYTQITQNLGFTGNYMLPGSERKRQSISTMINIMKGADEQGGMEQSTGTLFYNANATYSMTIVPKNFTLSTSLNFTRSEMLSMRSSTIGPTVSVSQSLFDKKMRITAACSMNNTYNDGAAINRIISVRGNASYVIKQKHNLNLSLVTLNRTVMHETGSSDFTEFTGTLGYGYNF